MLNYQFAVYGAIVLAITACTAGPVESTIQPSSIPTQPSETGTPQPEETKTPVVIATPTPTSSPAPSIQPSVLPHDNILQRLEQIPLESNNQMTSPFAVMDRKQISWQTQNIERVCVLPIMGSSVCSALPGFMFSPLATVLGSGDLQASAGGGWSSASNDAGGSPELSRAGYFSSTSSPQITEWNGFTFHDLALSEQGDGYLLLDDERPVSKQTGQRLDDLKETSLRYVSIRGYKPQHEPKVLVGLNYLGKGDYSVNGGNIDANGNGFAIYEPRHEPEVTRRVQYFSNLKPTLNVELKQPYTNRFSIDMQGNSGNLLWAEGQSIHVVSINNNQLSSAEQIVKLNTSVNFDLSVQPQRLDPNTFSTYTIKTWDALLDQQGNGAIIVHIPRQQQNALEVFKVEGYQVVNKTQYDIPDFQAIYNAKLLNNQGVIELVLLTGKCELNSCQVREALTAPSLWRGKLFP